jgi:hypothetical protein
VAASFRAVAPLLAGFALAACGGKPGPEDPAVAAGTGIPMGALSADGVSFDAPVERADTIPHVGGKIEAPPKAPAPVDPFDPEPTPPIKAPKKKGTSL